MLSGDRLCVAVEQAVGAEVELVVDSQACFEGAMAQGLDRHDSPGALATGAIDTGERSASATELSWYVSRCTSSIWSPVADRQHRRGS